MKKNTLKLLSTALLLFVILSIYSIISYRNLEREMGITYVRMYTSIINGIDIVKDDIMHFEFKDTDNYSDLFVAIGKINGLSISSYSLPPNAVFNLLREIQTDLSKMVEDDINTEEKNKRVKNIQASFEVLEKIIEIINEQMDKQEPLVFFREITSPESKTSKAIMDIFNDHYKEKNTQGYTSS